MYFTWSIFEYFVPYIEQENFVYRLFSAEKKIGSSSFIFFFLFAELMFVICWMLHPEVEFRAKLVDIINYPWFTRHVNINDYNYDSVLGKIPFFVFVFCILFICFFVFSLKKYSTLLKEIEEEFYSLQFVLNQFFNHPPSKPFTQFLLLILSEFKQISFCFP